MRESNPGQSLSLFETNLRHQSWYLDPCLIHETEAQRTVAWIQTATWCLTAKGARLLGGPPHFPRGCETQLNRRTRQLPIALNGRNRHSLHFEVRSSWDNEQSLKHLSLKSPHCDYSILQHGCLEVLGGAGTSGYFFSFSSPSISFVHSHFPRASLRLLMLATKKP